MIYNKDSTGFPELEDALKEFEVSAESIKFALAYLDTNNERDNGLLEKIKLHNFSKDLSKKHLDKLHKALKDEVLQKNNPELLMRYTLISYAIAGSYANKFFEYSYRWHLREFRFMQYLQALEERFLTALTSNYGEEGGLIRYYTILSHIVFPNRYNIDFKFNPEIAVNAALFLKEREPLKDAVCLCFNALLCTQTGCKEDYVRTATDMIVAYYKSSKWFYASDLAVLAEASVFSSEAKNLFVKNLNKDQSQIAKLAFKYDSIRIVDAIADAGNIDSNYISVIKNERGSIAEQHLHRLAKEYTDEFIKVMKNERDGYKMQTLRKIFAAERPDVEVNYDELKEQIQREVLETIPQLYKNPEIIRAYLLGEKSFDEIYPTLCGFKFRYFYSNHISNYYYTMLFGFDDFLARCVSVMAPCIREYGDYIKTITEFKIISHPQEFINMLMKETTSPNVMLDVVSKVIKSEKYFYDCVNMFSNVLENHMDFIKDADTSKLSSVGRILYANTLRKQPDRYKSNLLLLAWDSSNIVREILVSIYIKANWNDYICEFIKSEKSAMREFAVSVIEAQGTDMYTDVLHEAFAEEKSEKLKNRIAVLIGEKTTKSKTISADDELKKLTSASNIKKLDWLCKTPLSSVKLTDGSPADDTLLKGLMMCYAANAETVNPLAHKIAEELGITKEELDDHRIVPDMGFDEKRCRTFDYGKRQFSVYLTPSLEIEIFCEDKKVKNLPKPGANDDAEIAEKSYADFKEMKKQMKTVVKTQQERLEYILMCDRKWTCEKWKKLFVANPVMQCFAIGLIWGTYEDDRLVSTFRYLDDGSFTTSDEDRFELADDAVIGLIHPIELSEDEKNIWTSQLADYEIIQPFAQLSRPVYTVTDIEAKSTKCMRFNGNQIINRTLVNNLTKLGWEKGRLHDGGSFYEFYHYDITQIKENADGSNVSVGFTAELKFSGSYIGVFEIEAEEVTIEDLVFHTADEPYRNPIKCSDVSPRYFSEIIAQLTAAVDRQLF